MERAIEDIEQGRVYKYDSLDDLIKEIEGRRGQIAARRETLNGRLWYGEGGGGGGVFLGFEKKIPKYPVEMCKGIKDLFLVIYRNHLHHLHPFWTILEDFGNKELAVFLVFAVVLVVVDLCHQVFVNTSYGLAFISQFLHCPAY